MKITTLARFSKNATRFIEIATVLVKYGLATWIRERDPEFIKNILKSPEGLRLADLPPETRVRMALTELGTTFIKLGQILSTRADLVGPILADELARLQADTPPDSPELVRRTLESELGKPVEELFADFDFKAVASASIGQVHRARLHSGQVVIVKVQHEGIEEKATTDLDILRLLATLAEKHDPDLRMYQPQTTVEEFSRSLLRELDFHRELRNLERFGRNFRTDATVHMPKGYSEFSSRRVLTMEMLEGFSIAETERLTAEGIHTKELARRGANLYLEMVFRDGFFHADPHPGNIWVLPDGKIGLLDCGMVARLDHEVRTELEGMLLAVVDDDPGRIVEHLFHLASIPQGFDRNILRRDVEDFLADYVDASLRDFDLSSALDSLSEILRRHHLRLPAGTSMLIRVLVMLEGTSRRLDRDFSLAELLQPYCMRLIGRRFSPQKVLGRLQRTYRDWDRLFEMLPREMTEILTQMGNGKFDIHLEHHRLNTVANRLVYGMLTAALFLGSCLILSQKIPPLIADISIIGAAGCLLSVIAGYRLLRAIKKPTDL